MGALLTVDDTTDKGLEMVEACPTSARVQERYKY